LRRRRVIRYAILYFTLLILFVVLIVAPLIAAKFIKNLPALPMNLVQPTGLNNNDTTASHTGNGLAGADATGAVGDGATTAASTATGAARRWAFNEFAY